jgi:hypothetical protein
MPSQNRSTGRISATSSSVCIRSYCATATPSATQHLVSIHQIGNDVGYMYEDVLHIIRNIDYSLCERGGFLQ